MKLLFIIFFFSLSYILKAQNLIISAGEYYSNMTVSLLDPRPGKGEINSKTSYSAFDFNILIESKTFDIFSFKSGIYIHKGIYDYRRWSFEYVPLAGDQWSYTDEHYVMPSYTVPLLLAFNFKNKNEDKKLRFHIDAGLFLDHRLFQSDQYFEPYDFYKLNIGLPVSNSI